MKLKTRGMHLKHAVHVAAGALALTLPLMATAQQADGNVTVTRLTPAQAAKLAPVKNAVKAQAEQRAAVDENGKLRTHEHDDVRADAAAKTSDMIKRNAATASAAASQASKTVYRADGTVTQRFDVEAVDFVTAKVGKDGKITAGHDDGHAHDAPAGKTAKGAK